MTIAYYISCPFSVYYESVRFYSTGTISWRGLLGTNTLTFYLNVVDKEKSFIRLTPEDNFINIL
jgi:hypothetical protein